VLEIARSEREREIYKMGYKRKEINKTFHKLANYLARSAFGKNKNPINKNNGNGNHATKTVS
jgi:hypothetical protein